MQEKRSTQNEYSNNKRGSNMSAMSPYAASKVVNVVLEENSIAPIPPQMMYNYTTARVRAGKVPLIPINADNKIELADLEAWVTKYVTKKLSNIEAKLAENTK